MQFHTRFHHRRADIYLCSCRTFLVLPGSLLPRARCVFWSLPIVLATLVRGVCIASQSLSFTASAISAASPWQRSSRISSGKGPSSEFSACLLCLPNLRAVGDKTLVIRASRMRQSVSFSAEGEVFQKSSNLHLDATEGTTCLVTPWHWIRTCASRHKGTASEVLVP